MLFCLMETPPAATPNYAAGEYGSFRPHVPTKYHNIRTPPTKVGQSPSWVWRHTRVATVAQQLDLSGQTKEMDVYICLQCLIVHKKTKFAYKYSGGTSNIINHLRKHNITEETTKVALTRARRGAEMAAPTAAEKFLAAAPGDRDRMMIFKCAMVCVKDLRSFNIVEGEGFWCVFLSRWKDCTAASSSNSWTRKCTCRRGSKSNTPSTACTTRPSKWYAT